MREYLKKLREEMKLTQQKVADELGISANYYCMIEKGDRQKKMDLTLVTKLAEIFKVPVSEIIDNENKIA